MYRHLQRKKKEKYSEGGSPSIFLHHITITSIIAAITAATRERGTGNEKNLAF